jgi:hypothetical protein
MLGSPKTTNRKLYETSTHSTLLPSSFFSGLTLLLNPAWQIILKLRSSMLPVDIVKYW